MKTRTEAVQELRRWPVRDDNTFCGYVFQYPKAHWACCSPRSPNGYNLKETGNELHSADGRILCVCRRVYRVALDGSVTNWIKAFQVA